MDPMKDKCLILVNPPQQGLLGGFSNGLYALKSYLTRSEPALDVQMIDLGLTPQEAIEKKIKTEIDSQQKMLFVGITTTTASYQNALICAAIFKKLFPSCITIFGGHHATNQYELIVDRHSEVDFVIIGEGEIVLRDFLRHYPQIEHIRNLYFQDSNTSNIDPKAKATLLNQESLEEVPFVFPRQCHDSIPGKFGYTTYVSSRGCTFNCAFCSVGNGGVRAKSINKVLSEIRYMVQKLGYNKISIEDNFFNYSSRRTLELCEGLKELKKTCQFSWDCQTRVESLRDYNVLTHMEQAGCDGIYIGVEALHKDLLLYLEKTPSPEEYLEDLINIVIPQLLSTNIRACLNLQFGIPVETQRHIADSLDILTSLGKLAYNSNKHITLYPQLYVVYPGTKHFKKAIQENRYGPSSNEIFETFTAWEFKQKPILNWLGQHFAHGSGGLPEGILSLDELRNNCKFRIDVNAILGIICYLEKIEKLRGITVFKYGEFLAV